MDSSKRTRKRMAPKLALAAFALAMAGAGTAKAQLCATVELDCFNCDNNAYQVQCCTMSASCFFAELGSGNCDRPAKCMSECSDGTIYDCLYYCP
ncbi:MAG: hypothetical protein ACRD18_11325 [Terriglobia bacterium]